MKKLVLGLIGLTVLSMGAATKSEAAVTMMPGSAFNNMGYLNCRVDNVSAFAVQVVQVNYQFSCQEVVYPFRVATYNTSTPVAGGLIYPGNFQVFPGPALANCNVVAAACNAQAIF